MDAHFHYGYIIYVFFIMTNIIHYHNYDIKIENSPFYVCTKANWAADLPPMDKVVKLASWCWGSNPKCNWKLALRWKKSHEQLQNWHLRRHPCKYLERKLQHFESLSTETPSTLSALRGGFVLLQTHSCSQRQDCVTNRCTAPLWCL